MSQVPFEFQSRCDEVSRDAGATVFKAVAGYEGNSGTIEININNVTGNLDIYYNRVNRTTANISFTLGNNEIEVTKLNSSLIRAEFKSGMLSKCYEAMDVTFTLSTFSTVF